MADMNAVYKYYNGKSYDNIYFKTKGSLVEQDASHRFVSDTEKNTWNNKAAKNLADTKNNGLMSAADKIKLNGIKENANYYAHPTSSGNRHIPAGGKKNQILKYLNDGTAVWSDLCRQKSYDGDNTAVCIDNIDSTGCNFIEWKLYCHNKTEISTVYLELNSQNGNYIIEGDAGGTLYMEVNAGRLDNIGWMIHWKCIHRDGQWEKNAIYTDAEIKSIRVHTGGTGQVFGSARMMLKTF